STWVKGMTHPPLGTYTRRWDLDPVPILTAALYSTLFWGAPGFAARAPFRDGPNASPRLPGPRLAGWAARAGSGRGLELDAEHGGQPVGGDRRAGAALRWSRLPRQAGRGAGDEVGVGDAAQPEQELRILVEAHADAVQRGGDVLAEPSSVRAVRATALVGDLRGRRE